MGARAWHQLADGSQALLEAAQCRGGPAGLALGVVPLIYDLLLTPVAVGSPIAKDTDVSLNVAIPGSAEGDTVLVSAKFSGDAEPDRLFGLTPGPCSRNSTQARIVLQNRTDGDITVTGDFTIRITVLHILPEAPA